MHSEVNPLCENENEIIIIKANVLAIRYACRGWEREKQEETTVCLGIIITGKNPKLQNNIELKKFEVAKLFVIREQGGKKRLFWHHKNFMLCISSNT